MSLTPVKLLVVDDNPTTCSILRDYFQLNDSVALCGFAFDGSAAMEMIHLHQPDVVLLDLIMPKLDGLSVLEQLSEGDPNRTFHRPAVIVTSALGSEAITRRSLQLGANYYLIKPYQLDHLTDRIMMIMKPESIFTEQPEIEVDLGITVARHLISTGMATHIVGYRYCVQAIELLLSESSYRPLMKCVYPAIAARNDTTVACVESAIRKAITTVQDPELNQLSNRSFLSRIAEQVRMKYQLFPTDIRKEV